MILRTPRPATWTAFFRDVRAAFEADEPLLCDADDGCDPASSLAASGA